MNTRSQNRKLNSIALLTAVFILYMVALRQLPEGKNWLDLLQGLMVPTAVIAGVLVSYMNFTLAEKKREDDLFDRRVSTLTGFRDWKVDLEEWSRQTIFYGGYLDAYKEFYGLKDDPPAPEHVDGFTFSIATRRPEIQDHIEKSLSDHNRELLRFFHEMWELRFLQYVQDRSLEVRLLFEESLADSLDGYLMSGPKPEDFADHPIYRDAQRRMVAKLKVQQ